ncbi:hypothetical protein SAMN05444156_2186 [Verrucomicrobium sp. GAS474]|uniref:DUF6908 domain-containing protein n=1 Tax=Verrucomicrobium sp. GAS474 TaxID=1882831 RepID=UPI00087A06A0|nr:hypothetical protein [Verrucomicrobium sp. GAS474]SDU13818.1 hypothetical protein SAMN05444156_2186 [Verrucomicrobium sp. GAS474]
MKNLIRFVNRRGDVRLMEVSMRLVVDGFNPLVVENIGFNSYYHPTELLLSVAHYGTQNGDAMRDPEIVFAAEFDREGKLSKLHPCYFRNDYLGLETQGYFEEEGRQMMRPQLIAEWRRFAVQWDRNLVAQGFFNGSAR